MPKAGQLTVVRMLAAVLAFGLLTSLMIPTYSIGLEKSVQVKGMSNCKQVLITLMLYAADNDGRYPEGGTSNEAFRKLFVDGQCNNETIFACPTSPFIPDGNVGTPPDFIEAVKAGENHWAMTAHLTERSSGNIPLIYENPAIASWPPEWAAPDRITSLSFRAHANTPEMFKWARPELREPSRKRGECWAGDRIIVGLNDTSVSLLRLKDVQRDKVRFANDAKNKDLFDIHPEPGEQSFKVLDVEDNDLTAIRPALPSPQSSGLDLKWHLATWGHIIIGLVLPALLFWGWTVITDDGSLLLRFLVVVAGAWFCLNWYYVLIQSPAYILHAASHPNATYSGVEGELIFLFGWMEPLVACLLICPFVRVHLYRQGFRLVRPPFI